MSDAAGGPWWRALPPAETEIGCGPGRHVIRWADGNLVLPSHLDLEGESVLAALGGADAACVELAGMWQRHDDDLDVLALGPRSAADEITVTWESVKSDWDAASSRGIGRVRSRPMLRPGASHAVAGRSAGPGPQFDRRLAASLPAGWLAEVWACGLAVVGGHLVVAVLDAHWPRARVLALPEPGARPAVLGVRAVAPANAGLGGSGDGAHWVVTDTGEEAAQP